MTNSASSREEAMNSAELLVRAYPRRMVDDPEVYVQMMVFTFMLYPVEIHMQAIERLTAKLKFIPTRAELIEVCDEIQQARKWREPSPEEARMYLAERPWLEREPTLIPADWRPKIS